MRTQTCTFRKVAAAAFVLISIGVARCQKPAEVASRADEYMQSLVKLDRFSGAILIARNGQILESGGYGLANAEWSNPNTRDTKFRIGSVTKQFTAMAIMILQERGKLHVTDSVCPFLEKCPATWKSITIHQLLTHTSGIPDYVEFPDFEQTQALAATPDQLIARFRDKPLEFTPGDKFQYSNSGYVLLGAIIEKASGEPYKEFLKLNILDVLGMNDSGYDSTAAILPHRAAGYSKHGKTLENANYIDPSVAYAAGAMYSTCDDLLKWDNALYTDRLVSRKSLQDIFTSYKEVVGYGWAIGSLFNRIMEHHNGGINGFVSNVARFPEDKVLLVVLGNRDGLQIDSITKDLAAIVFGEPYALPTERKIVTLSPEMYDSYVGTYEITPDIKVIVTRQGQHLFTELTGSEGGKFEVLPESETKFFSEDPPVEIVFAKDQKGRATDILLNGQYRGKRIPSP